MSRDPMPERAPLVCDADDEEFMRAVRRIEARVELPSEAKMQEMAARLRPIVAKQNSDARSNRWLVIVAMGGAVVSAALFLRLRFEMLSNRVPATDVVLSEQPAPQRTPAPPKPPGEVHDTAALAISVDALPTPSSSPGARPPHAEPACNREIELVDRADAALRAGDAQRALDLTREHGERCPNGVFVQERERLAIEALASLGRMSEVRARARPFEKRFPASPHVRRIRSLAGESE